MLCAYRMYLVRVSEMRELFMLKMASVEHDATDHDSALLNSSAD